MDIEGAHGTTDLAVVGNDIIGGACMDGAGVDHGGLLGVHFIAADVGEGLHDLGSGKNGVDAVLGRSAMAALAVENDPVIVAGSGNGAPAQLDLAGLIGLTGDVDGHSVVGLGIFQTAVLDHGTGAGQSFLTRLEHQDHKALEFLFMGFQQFGRTQQHGGMGVMAAGVHFSRALGGIGQAGVLGEGQSIHISPEKDAFASFFADVAQHAALAAGTETDAHFL